MKTLKLNTRRHLLVCAVSVALAAMSPLSAMAEGLTILHVGDQETWLVSAQGNLRDNGGQAISFYGGVDRLATVIANASASATAANRSVLKLNAGDAILPGPRLNASLDKLANSYADGGQDFYDAIAMRQIGFDATVFGNHEFDLGPNLAARFAEVSGTTYLSSNLDFNSNFEFSKLKLSGKVAASKIVTTKGGKKIGIVGATTPLLPAISSPGDLKLNQYSASATELQNLQALIPILQSEINDLRKNHEVTTVILMSHLQNVDNERSVIVPALSGVDLVISGGGHELMTDTDDLLINGGVAPTFNTHPVYATDVTGKQIPVVTGHFGNRYVGEVNATIDDVTGQMTSIDSTRMLRVSGAAADADKVQGDPVLNANVVAPVLQHIAALNAKIIGSTAIKLNGPTHTTCTLAPCKFVAGVRNAETGLGDLVADAMRFAGKADVAIQNGGGIRTNIAVPGNLSVGDTFNILPFTNLVKTAPVMKASQLKDILEHSVSSASPLGAVNGKFAQISGMQVVYDSTKPARTTLGTGSRIQRVVLDDGTVLIDGGVVVNDSREFSFSTIDFTANGGDGYQFIANGVVFDNNVNTITYQEALANYIATPKADGGLGRSSDADGDEVTPNLYGIENQYDAYGRLVDLAIATIVPGKTLNGTANRDVLIGTDGDDIINGGPGADILTGGAGGDKFVFSSMRDAGDTITDFTPYADKLVLDGLLAGMGINKQDAISNGNILLADVTGGVRVLVDSDGSAGPVQPRVLVTLKGLTAAQFVPARDLSM